MVACSNTNTIGESNRLNVSLIDTSADALDQVIRCFKIQCTASGTPVARQHIVPR
ncbi:MAG: hypothetical protein PVJ63_06210 [Thioalkalispiraceae bacterium]